MPFATIQLIPTTRPDASASGPPEFPGRSRMSASIKCPLGATWTIPKLTALASPSGCPTATTTPRAQRQVPPLSAFECADGDTQDG